MQYGQNYEKTRTIEGDIAKALVRCKLIWPDEERTAKFDSASRTDSRVSARLALFGVWAAEVSDKIPEI